MLHNGICIDSIDVLHKLYNIRYIPIPMLLLLRCVCMCIAPADERFLLLRTMCVRILVASYYTHCTMGRNNSAERIVTRVEEKLCGHTQHAMTPAVKRTHKCALCSTYLFAHCGALPDNDVINSSHSCGQFPAVSLLNTCRQILTCLLLVEVRPVSPVPLQAPTRVD